MTSFEGKCKVKPKINKEHSAVLSRNAQSDGWVTIACPLCWGECEVKEAQLKEPIKYQVLIWCDHCGNRTSTPPSMIPVLLNPTTQLIREANTKGGK